MGTHKDIIADLAAALLLEKIVRETYEARASTEIQPLQWSVLRYLSAEPPHRCTMSRVRDFLGLTHAPVVRAINTLVRRGLVEQREHPEDARSRLLALTPPGIAALRSDPILGVAERIASLSHPDRLAFRKLVRQLVVSGAAEGDGNGQESPADRG